MGYKRRISGLESSLVYVSMPWTPRQNPSKLTNSVPFTELQITKEEDTNSKRSSL